MYLYLACIIMSFAKNIYFIIPIIIPFVYFTCLFIALLWWLGHVTVLSGKIGNLVSFPAQRKSFVLPWRILLTIGFFILFIRLRELLSTNTLQKVLSFHVEFYQMYFYLFYDHIWSFLYYDKWIVLITSQVLKQSMFLE